MTEHEFFQKLNTIKEKNPEQALISASHAMYQLFERMAAGEGKRIDAYDLVYFVTGYSGYACQYIATHDFIHKVQNKTQLNELGMDDGHNYYVGSQIDQFTYLKRRSIADYLYQYYLKLYPGKEFPNTEMLHQYVNSEILGTPGYKSLGRVSIDTTIDVLPMLWKKNLGFLEKCCSTNEEVQMLCGFLFWDLLSNIRNIGDPYENICAILETLFVTSSLKYEK